MKHRQPRQATGQVQKFDDGRLVGFAFVNTEKVYTEPDNARMADVDKTNA